MERQAKMLTYMKDMNYFTATRLKPESQQFIYTNIYDMIYTVVLVSQCSTDLLKRCASNHGGPSEAGDCSHPPPKMATAKNASSCKATFDHVIGIGSLRFFACEQVLDIANPWYSNGRSSRDSLTSRGTRVFQREAGDSMAPDRRRRVTHGWEAGDSYFRFNFCELLFRCHTQY